MIALLGLLMVFCFFRYVFVRKTCICARVCTNRAIDRLIDQSKNPSIDQETVAPEADDLVKKEAEILVTDINSQVGTRSR